MILHALPKNSRDGKKVAYTVAKEFRDLWLVADARIPLNLVNTFKIKIKVLDFRETHGFL